MYSSNAVPVFHKEMLSCHRVAENLCCKGFQGIFDMLKLVNRLLTACQYGVNKAHFFGNGVLVIAYLHHKQQQKQFFKQTNNKNKQQ